MFSLSQLSGKAKAFVDWLDKIPGFAAAGIGLGVGMFVPTALSLGSLFVIGVVYLVLKFDLGNRFK